MLQESVIDWEPAYGGGELTWLALACVVLTGIGLAAYWKALRWVVVSRIDREGWRATRYALPAAMLFTSGSLLILSQLRSGWAIEIPLIALLCLSAAAYPGAGAAVAISDSLNLTEWQARVLLVALSWLSWYAAIRLIEWQHERNLPIALNLNASSRKSDN